MAINFANEPANITGSSGVRLLTNNDIDNSGVSSIVMGGIPDTAVKVYIYFANYSTDGSVSGRFRLRLGAGAGNNIDTGNRYHWNTFFREGTGSANSHYGTGTSYMNVLDTDHSGAAHADTGVVTLTKCTHPSSGSTNGGWMMECLAGDTTRNLSYFANGRWEATTALNTIQVFNSGYGYDAGARMTLLYEIGDYN